MRSILYKTKKAARAAPTMPTPGANRAAAPGNCAAPLLVEAGGAEPVGVELVALATALEILEAAEEAAEETLEETADEAEEAAEETLDETEEAALLAAALLAEVGGAVEDRLGAVTVTPAALQVFSTPVMTAA